MLRSARLVLILLTLPAVAAAQGPRKSTLGSTSFEIKLTTDVVTRMLAALPEITEKASAQQGAFLGNLTGGPGSSGMPQMSPKEVEKLRAIFTKHGFTMEEFAMQVSALLATYLILDEKAFERQLPSEDKPEIRAILTDPNIPQTQKDAIRKQIQTARNNKGQIRQQLAQLATDNNKSVVKPLLPKVRKAFEKAEATARKSMESSKRGPRRVTK